MNYQETEEYILSKLPNYQAIGGKAFNKSLDKTKALASFLGNPQEKFRSIHVAGTNGKGSVSSMLASVFSAAGWKAGLFTSPHLATFRERIRVNGMMIEESFVIDFIERIRPFIEEKQPSFFEISTLMAFQYFQEQQVDIAIIETGLGGRLDSTNIISPVMSVITNISYDHQNMLGNTLEEIAMEKAGIIKSSAPVVIGDMNADLYPIFQEKAQEAESEVAFSEDIELSDLGLDTDFKRKVECEGKIYLLDLPGKYQVQNVQTVFRCMEVLKEQGIAIAPVYLEEGLSNVQQYSGLQGRFQVINRAPFTVLDVAHNESGIGAVLEQIQALNPPAIHCVFGAVNDKNVERILSLFPANTLFYLIEPKVFRSKKLNELVEVAKSLKLSYKPYNSIQEAYRDAVSGAKKEEVIYIGGSTFVVADFVSLIK